MSTDRLIDPVINFFNMVDDMKRPYAPSDTFGPIISICFDSGYTLNQARCRLIKGISDYFDLSLLQGLLLDWGFTSSEIHTIRDSFGKLPKLKILNVPESLPEICLVIAESLKDSPAQRPEENQACCPSQRKKKLQHVFPPITVFPALRTLIIECVDFRRYRHPENLEHLVDILMERSDMNAPIDTLRLEQCCGVRTWQKRLLGELVVNLEVEGEVIDVSELDSYEDGNSEDDDSDEDDGESFHSTNSDYSY